MSLILNDLYDYNLKIYQDTDLFKFSLDSLLLSEFTDVYKSDQKLLDLCSGNAPLPLILSTKYPHLSITGVEIQKPIYDLAMKSIKFNHLENRINMLNINALDISDYFPGNNFDIITCNPPYFKINENSYLNAQESLAIARHEITINLEDIFYLISQNLKHNGRFYLVHRPERITEIITLAHKYQLEPKIIEFIYPKENECAIMILFKFVYHGKVGAKIYSRIVNRSTTTYQNIFAKEHNRKEKL